MLFEVFHGETVAGTFETPVAALEKANELMKEGAPFVSIRDAVGRRYSPREFERTYLPKKPPR
jgi:hypothetical protein